VAAAVIGLTALYTLAGLVFAGWAVVAWRDAGSAMRWRSGAFWALLAISFLAGDRLGDLGNGVLVLALVALALAGAPARLAAPANPPAPSVGNVVFVPALVVPAAALAGTLAAPHLGGLIDPRQATLVSLAAGAVLGVALLVLWLGQPLAAALVEGRRLAHNVGWAMILPQMLASLGVLFLAAGVGDIVGRLAPLAIPDGSRLAAVLAFTGGMALFTMLMGNAFAAFPVMMGGIGLPLLVAGMGGDPAIIGAVGMLAGFSGTLATPMAANFNIVPAALLGLDRMAVIRAQWPTALVLWLFNTALIWGWAF
jgi:uncharacterized membrane protein